ncbi:MAG: mechanosensitive ion channel family protein [Treponema sp.]|jgi:small-conductance mechanosensitive channel|nr:mechanosensitive ion channel family protein [Treponema sp.]
MSAIRAVFMLSFISLSSALSAQTNAADENFESGVSSVVNELVGKNIFIRCGIAAAVIILMILLIRLVGRLLVKLQNKIQSEAAIKPVVFKNYTLLDSRQIANAFSFLVKIFKYVAYAVIVYLTLPILFGIFEQTRNVAARLIGYIISPLKNAGITIVKYIPNLITIFITFIISHYTIKAVKFFTTQIQKGALIVPGFYADWAQPTFNILRILIYAFTIILIYPLLPNSESDIFKGVSVFIGILFSLGSSSVIGNLVAGIVVTYMRPFKLGDRIQIGTIIGFVVEKSATVTRLRTHKNEYITFPNSMILTSSITNYNFSADNEEDQGLILHVTVTFGYSTPWQTVHSILIESALKTRYVEPDPMPFVLQTKLDDFYAHYEINAYTKAIEKVPAVYSELYKNIQNGFRDAGLDMTVSYVRSYMPYTAPFMESAEAHIVEDAEGAEKKEGKKG